MTLSCCGLVPRNKHEPAGIKVHTDPPEINADHGIVSFVSCIIVDLQGSRFIRPWSPLDQRARAPFPCPR